MILSLARSDFSCFFNFAKAAPPSFGSGEVRANNRCLPGETNSDVPGLWRDPLPDSRWPRSSFHVQQGSPSLFFHSGFAICSYFKRFDLTFPANKNINFCVVFASHRWEPRLKSLLGASLPQLWAEDAETRCIPQAFPVFLLFLIGEPRHGCRNLHVQRALPSSIL